MNELDFGKKISQYLTRSANHLDTITIAKLKAARESALAKYRVEESVLAHAHASPGSGKWGEYFSHHPRLWFGVLLLLAAVMASISLLQMQEQSVESPIDAQILSSDMPLHAFTRGDFQSWLNESSR